jgi:hypothetical protein
MEEANDSEETSNITHVHASYSIISYPASQLPEQYKALIFSKWLRSLRFGNPVFKKIESSQYYKNYHLFIEKLLAKPDSIIRLAVLTDDHDVVLGFAISREDVLDYVHVHGDYRRIGISKKLIPEGITVFSHFTLTWGAIWQSKLKHLKFDPFA